MATRTPFVLRGEEGNVTARQLAVLVAVRKINVEQKTGARRADIVPMVGIAPGPVKDLLMTLMQKGLVSKDSKGSMSRYFATQRGIELVGGGVKVK